jgi:type VI secretion system protein ImpA
MEIPATTWTAVTSPISVEAPCGRDLRLDDSSGNALHRIRHLRHQAALDERQAAFGDVDPHVVAAKWKEILELVTESLQTQTKDLELAAYLLEATLRLSGLRGLSQALAAISQLVRGHWDTLHPCSNEIEERLSHLNGLNGIDSAGTLLPALTTTPLISIPENSPITLSRYTLARRTGSSQANGARDQSNNADSLDSLKRLVATVDPADLEEFRQTLRGVAQAFEDLDEQLTARSGNGFFSSAIHTRLASCHEVFVYLCGPEPLAPQTTVIADSAGHDRLPEDADTPEETGQPDVSAGENAPVTPEGSVMPPEHSIHSRQQALQTLADIAQYFEAAEPHSPIGYAIRQTIAWGNMSLPELVQQLIPDTGARQTYFALSGMRNPAEPNIELDEADDCY